jgi:hypothetical protein
VAERPKFDDESCKVSFNVETTEKKPGLHYKLRRQMKQPVHNQIENNSQDSSPRRLFLMSSLISTFTLGMSVLAGSSEGRYELSKILLRARRRYLL